MLRFLNVADRRVDYVKLSVVFSRLERRCKFESELQDIGSLFFLGDPWKIKKAYFLL